MYEIKTDSYFKWRNEGNEIENVCIPNTTSLSSGVGSGAVFQDGKIEIYIFLEPEQDFQEDVNLFYMTYQKY